jgi:hypothetical protein
MWWEDVCSKTTLITAGGKLLQFCYMAWAGGRHTDKFGMKLFHSLFVRYGSASAVFLPITQAKCWNAVAWTIIALGTVAWGVMLLVWNF